jgi:hypothetical protein
MPPLPSKPRPVIIEKWLPYKTTTERPILYQRTENNQQIRPAQRNLILQYDPPHVHIKKFKILVVFVLILKSIKHNMVLLFDVQKVFEEF